MGRIAVVFSGQGAQCPGMGRDLYDRVPAAAEIFARVDALRPGTARQCFEGTAAELSETVNTQPCMVAMELAAAAALTAGGVMPDMAAGFSLGELAALIFTGALSFEEGFGLVCLRGKLMQRDSEQTDSGMAAVVKLEPEQVEAICANFKQVYPVNYNCPGQITVAGLLEEMEAFSRAVKAAGGRAIPLKVRGAFHSPFMACAAEDFAAALEGVTLSTPRIPLYSNLTGQPYEGDMKALLSKQICSPVRWQDIVTRMAGAGADTFIEVGPGTTLSGFIAKTVPQARVFHVENFESLRETLEGVGSC